MQIKSNEIILGGGGITSDKDESLFSKAWTTIRESIASALAILIIAVTLYFLWPALTAKPVAIDDAQAIFSILGGWGGVVLGYYFGRLPAEKAADKADAAAEKARAQRNSSDKKRILLTAKYDTFIDKQEKLLNNTIHKLQDLPSQTTPTLGRIPTADLMNSLINDLIAEIASVKVEKETLEKQMNN